MMTLVLPLSSCKCVTVPKCSPRAMAAENTPFYVVVPTRDWTDFEDPLKTFWGIVSQHMWAVLLLPTPQDYLTTSAKQLRPVFRKMPAALQSLDGSLSPIISS